MIKNFFGADQFIWWKGVVEDRDDPLFLGRTKTRIFGWHTQDKTEMPTEKLPWSYAIIPIDNGTNVVGLKPGDWVIGFFRDGIVAQEPIIFGVLPGIPEDPANPELGFYDPVKYPLDCEVIPRTDPQCLNEHRIPTPKEVAGDCCGPLPVVLDEVPHIKAVTPYPLEDRLTEPTSSRLQRVEMIGETIVPRKLEDIGVAKLGDHKSSGVGTDIAYVTDVWEEPPTPYNAKYPYNHVYQSEGGHYIEYDDTPDNERLHWYHKTGTFHEIHPNATTVTKVKRQSYTFVIHEWFNCGYKDINWTSGLAMRFQSGTEMIHHSCGDMNRDTEMNLNTIVRVDSNKRVQNDDNRVVDVDSNTKIKNFRNTIVENHVNNHFKANVHTLIDVDENKVILNNLNEIIAAFANMSIGADGTLVIGGDLKIAVKGKLNVGVDGDITLDTSQQFTVNSLNADINADVIARMDAGAMAEVSAGLNVSCNAPLISMNGETYGFIHALDALIAAELGSATVFPPLPVPPLPGKSAPHDYTVDAPLIEPEDPEKGDADPSC